MIIQAHTAPATSVLIASLDDALAFYAERIAGVRKVTSGGARVTVFCPPDLTHPFSEEEEDESVRAALGPDERVTRQIGADVEVRRFALDRARQMGLILPTISKHSCSVAGPSKYGRTNQLLLGPLPDGRYLKVVLQPFSGPKRAHRLISAFPVSAREFGDAQRATQVPFPPPAPTKGQPR